MSNPKEQFRIKLTAEQKSQVRNATGKEAEAVELSVEELEERIAPAKRGAQRTSSIAGALPQRVTTSYRLTTRSRIPAGVRHLGVGVQC